MSELERVEYFHGEKMPMADLKLRDVVSVSDYEFSYAIVKQIKDGNITFYRPYAVSEDWSHTGGVICYMGVEEFTTPIIGTVRLWRREVKPR